MLVTFGLSLDSFCFVFCVLNLSQIYSAKTFENQLGGWRSATLRSLYGHSMDSLWRYGL